MKLNCSQIEVSFSKITGVDSDVQSIVIFSYKFIHGELTAILFYNMVQNDVYTTRKDLFLVIA